ncbi:ATP-binding cassette domain-containing protein [Microbacterium maritypicum]|uniref:ABC transporter domain-containing protein n=1 Tax=Microbacterium maritypicum TaxID=33918 RepID=A0A4Y4B9A1_MICMQ|nr:hypothetical protein MLI01_16720 [Microbacterium liquefaciens]GGV63925.1 hypothetical protein GCM10010213_29020 [Microbacterium liquefaciens]
MRLVVRDVGVAFGGEQVLHGVSTVFGAGETTALMGPSGSGKSTLLAAIAGAVPLSSGTVELTSNGNPPVSSERIDPEWIMQSAPLLQRRQVVDNVMLSCRVRGVGPEEALARSMRALFQVGVAHLARRRTFQLSGGEKQRVAVARAIAARAPLLLADEPTASLDARSRDATVDALRQAARSGAIVIVATHDDQVAEACQRVLRLTDGWVVEGGG